MINVDKTKVIST